MDAIELIASIKEEKNKAIGNGLLREEKKLDPITDKDVPRNLPAGWAWCRLGDYAMKVTDYVASGSFASLKENVLITNDVNYAVMVKTADFSNDFTKNLTYTDEKGYRFLENSNLFGGELILSNIGSIGKVFIVPDLKRPMTLASNTVMIRMTNNDYNKFMYYMFKSPFGQNLLQSISSGTSMLKFNKTQLKSTIIPVAPLEVQKNICNVLDKLQRIIDERALELEYLDTLIKARFVEMFGDPESNSKNWPVYKLSDLCNVGSSKRIYQEEQTADGIPFWRISDLVNKMDTGSADSGLYISQDKYNELIKNDQVPVAGDILVTSRGTLGRCYIISDTDKFYFQDGMISWLSKYKTGITPLYIKYLFMTSGLIRQINGMQAGSTVAYLSIGMLKKLNIMLPDLEAQNNFADFVYQVDKSKVV